MSAPVTSWTEQEGIENVPIYNEATLSYDDATTFYNGYDLADYEPRPLVWTDQT